MVGMQSLLLAIASIEMGPRVLSLLPNLAEWNKTMDRFNRYTVLAII